MSVKSTFVIVGAGLAGAKAAETLRTEGFEGRVVLVGDEAARPYERPPLSKDYLRGEKGFDAAAVHEQGFYDANGIELLTSTTAESIDPKVSEVVLSTGKRLGYDRLLLATGAAPRRLEIPGADLPGVHYLRRLEDADRLRQALRGRLRVAVIGSGWIGLEAAASARQLGAEVVLVGRDPLPLTRILGAEVGGIYRELHEGHGVRQRYGVGPESFRGSSSVEEIRLSDGTTERADLVVVGVGVAPRTALAEQAGLAVADGVTVDEHLQANIPGIYAAGDIASAFHPRYETHIRVEHWAAALNQGPAAAQNMLGRNHVYRLVPYFYSDQYDFGMEYRGWAPAWDRVVFRGNPAGGEFIAFWMRHGRVVAAMNANVRNLSVKFLYRQRHPRSPGAFPPVPAPAASPDHLVPVRQRTCAPGRLVRRRVPGGQGEHGTGRAERHRRFAGWRRHRRDGQRHRGPLRARHHDDARNGCTPALRADHRTCRQVLTSRDHSPITRIGHTNARSVPTPGATSLGSAPRRRGGPAGVHGRAQGTGRKGHRRPRQHLQLGRPPTARGRSFGPTSTASPPRPPALSRHAGSTGSAAPMSTPRPTLTPWWSPWALTTATSAPSPSTHSGVVPAAIPDRIPRKEP